MSVPFPGPGIHFGYPEHLYFQVEACSASVSKAMLRSPWDAWASSWMNRLRPEKKSEALKLGKANHVMLLEGERAFGERYDIEPVKEDYEGLLTTQNDMKAYLREHGNKVTGTNAELTARIREFDAIVPIWHEITAEFESNLNGRLDLKREKWLEIQRARFVLNNLPSTAELFSQPGAAEVSIFWIGPFGVPMKCRLDKWLVGAIVDLKTFANQMGKEVYAAAIGALCRYRYDVQAVIYLDAVAAMKQLYAEHGMSIIHGEVPPHLPPGWLGEALTAQENRFCFTFLQTGDVPNVITLEFSEFEERATRGEDGATKRTSNTYFSNAVMSYRTAVERYDRFMREYGPDKPWVVDFGVRRLRDSHLPLWMLQEAPPENLDIEGGDDGAHPDEPERQAA
jgi:hypothetical protein